MSTGRITEESILMSRMAECLSPPHYLCVFSGDLVALEIIPRVVVGRGLQAYVGALRYRSPEGVYAIVYLREERCWNECIDRCGSHESLCFPRCFYECMNDASSLAKEALRV